MCDRKCICKDCTKNCCKCLYAEKKLNECRNGGIKECEHFMPIKEDK